MELMKLISIPVEFSRRINPENYYYMDYEHYHNVKNVWLDYIKTSSRRLDGNKWILFATLEDSHDVHTVEFYKNYDGQMSMVVVRYHIKYKDLIHKRKFVDMCDDVEDLDSYDDMYNNLLEHYKTPEEILLMAAESYLSSADVVSNVMYSMAVMSEIESISFDYVVGRWLFGEEGIEYDESKEERI